MDFYILFWTFFFMSLRILNENLIPPELSLNLG